MTLSHLCNNPWAFKLLFLSLLTLSQAEEQCSAPVESLSQPDWTGPGRIFDITLPLSAETVVFESPHGLGNIRDRSTRIEEGDLSNQSFLKELPMHLATHVDAPGHFVHESYATGAGVEGLNLYALNGPALVLAVPHHTNITADALEDLHIPPGVKRIIFKTQNTARDLMHQKAFESSYVGITRDGAEWLADNTDVELVGVDYLSVALYEDLPGAHMVFLPRGIIPLEGLVLNAVTPGLYDLHCLPLLVVSSDGAPTRCILISR